MLRKITPFGKLFFDEVAAIDLYNTFYANFRIETEVCQCCKSTGNCCVHGYYKRNLIDYFNGKIKTIRILVLRIVCNTCGHTHAVLPDILVPYAQHTVRFIIRVVTEKLTSTLAIEAICEKFDITYKTLYRFLEIYREHKALWLGVLKSIETPLGQFMPILCTYECFSDFMSVFSKRFGFSFMQRHANPANSRQRHTEHMYEA